VIGLRGIDTTVAERRRMSAGLMGSIAFHVLVVAWIAFAPSARPVDKLTEITLVDPNELDAPGAAPEQVAAATATSLAAQPSSGAAAEHSRDERFRRSGQADLAPTSQVESAVQDRLAARLATLQSTAIVPSAGVIKSAQPSPWSAQPATVPGTGGTGSAPVALKRDGSSGPPLALTRGGGGSGGATLAPALARAPESVTRSEAEPARAAETTASKRTLAGATLMGPIADRDVIQQTTPLYPDWAKREAVEASVTLYFVVRPDGSVRENVLVQKTAGFEDFDENARAALRAWRFQALRDGRTGDQWGTITFHYRIRDGG
jgi:TonB family protein